MSTQKSKKPLTNLDSSIAVRHRHSDNIRMKHYPNSARIPGFPYRQKRVIGRGAFGLVFESEDINRNPVAVKKVILDPHYKNRELGTLKKLNHRNCIKLIDSFNMDKEKQKDTSRNHSSKSKTELFIVMDFLPLNLRRFSKAYYTNRKIPFVYLQLFSYQIFAGLNYLHTELGITHRDIKPENILIDTNTGELKICDFGSAKELKPGDKSVSYIASRYYRAPELLLDCTSYTSAIDIWAAGCVIAEILLKGDPLFQGSSNDDQMAQIVAILGPPSNDDLSSFEHPPVKFKFQSSPTVYQSKLPNSQLSPKSNPPNQISKLNITKPPITSHPPNEKPPSIILTAPNGQPITRKAQKSKSEPTIEKPQPNRQKLEIQKSSNESIPLINANESESINNDVNRIRNVSVTNSGCIDSINENHTETKDDHVVDTKSDNNDNSHDKHSKSENNHIKSDNNENSHNDKHSKSDNNEVKSDNNVNSHDKHSKSDKNEQTKITHLLLKPLSQKAQVADNGSHSSDKIIQGQKVLKQRTTLKDVLPSTTPHLLFNLLETIFVYDVEKRPTAKECMQHKFFHGLFSGNCELPNHTPIPPIDPPV